ncbi:MAG: 50S ribosomal protein L13 [candidate division Zixibacteria bacterium SM23_73_2]|nr:MAG: 50S ribosomal protein L13 [candidate division Zixibacteria bacterium SM23_73_2]
MKTYVPKMSEVKRQWYLVDAQDKILGRLATEIAKILRGKTKPEFTPHLDLGDYVVVINAGKVILFSDKKEKQKTYYHHSGYPGGLKKIAFAKMKKEKPEQIIRDAVSGMLPHNRLGRKIISKLFVYMGGDHPHQAQKPQPLNL